MAEITTGSGNNFYIITSLMQKAIRRGDYEVAAKAAGDIFKVFPNYATNRLPIVFAEDCDGYLGRILMPKLDILIQSDKDIKKLKKSGDMDAVEVKLNESLSIINELIYLLAKTQKNRDVDLFMNFKLKRGTELLRFKSKDEFSDLNDYYNYLYKVMLANDSNPEILGMCLFLMYTYYTPSRDNNKVTLEKITNILNFIIDNDKFNLSNIQIEEIQYLIKMHKHKYMKIKLAERHTGADDSIYILLRIGFALSGFYNNVDLASINEDELLPIDELGIGEEYNFVNIPEYAFDKHTGKKMTTEEFLIRETKATVNLNNRLYDVLNDDISLYLNKDRVGIYKY